MILGNNAIKRALINDDIWIRPYREDLLQGVSYDVRLDKYFCIPTLNSGFHCGVFDEYLLGSHDRVLASTVEQIGSLSIDITTKIHAKSTTGRQGLEICSCAGFGDPYYANHWTLEIYNKNPYPVSLKYGMVIGQISFEEVRACNKAYMSKYNNNGTIKTYTEDERFQIMLPKEFKVITDDLKGE
jgi:dCTP deaminase